MPVLDSSTIKIKKYQRQSCGWEGERHRTGAGQGCRAPRLSSQCSEPGCQFPVGEAQGMSIEGTKGMSETGRQVTHSP